MIGDTTNFTEYVGNGSTVTAYAIPFRYDAAGWVVVTLRNPAGDVTNLEQIVDYTLGGTGLTANGYFTTVAAVPATHVLTIYREAPGIQSLDLAINTPLPAVSLEAQLDRIAMAAADSIGQREMEARVRPTFSTTAPADTTVPWINTTTRPYVLNYYYNGAWEPIIALLAQVTPIPRSTAQGPPDASVAPVILGRLCILGDAGGAYRTFHAVQLSPIIWLETTPGVVTNTTRSVVQKLTTTGTATNEIIQIADL